MLKKILRNILNVFPLGKYIMFESIPDLSDNTKAVFDEMLSRGLNEKYKFVWWVTDKKKEFPKYKNTIYIDRNTTVNRLVFRWYTIRAKCLICCNKWLTSIVEKQKSFYLTHGTAIKHIEGYYVPLRISDVIIASEQTKEMMAREFQADINKFVALGFPRNDILQKANLDLHKYFKNDFDKVIVWYPTFRQHKNGVRTNSKNALPVIYDTQQAIRLNQIAKERNVLVVVKPHFAQDISYISDYNLSNIKFIDDSFFSINAISSYEFVGSCDALITDYSSIYFDYLLCDKPLAVVWEDIEDYRQKPGFAIDVDFYLRGAEKIYNLSDFETFICNVAESKDQLAEVRKEINLWANYSSDGKNAIRVVDYIIDKANL